MTKNVKIKLLPAPEQSALLVQTAAVFNQICNWLSEQAFEHQEFRKNQLQKLTYQRCRREFPKFSSQLVVRAIDTVCQAYKLDKRKQRVFRPRAATVYDQRILSFKHNTVSIWTVGGRQRMPMQIWNPKLFHGNKGQSDLVCQNGKWYLHVSVWYADPPVKKTDKFLGVDLGVNSIAVTSDGKVYSSEAIEKKRKQYANHRRRLQLRNTRNAKRRIRKAGNKEARFRKDVNHRISKELVVTAKGTSLGIAIENLKGIQQRTTVRRVDRNRRMSWSFFQLRQFLEYKTADAGVKLVVVNSKNTSRMCSVCGYINKKNRRSQSEFKCLTCGHSENADLNAAKNISNRAAVNLPIAAATASLQAAGSLSSGS
jgi:IS605 OrfB family transposase